MAQTLPAAELPDLRKLSPENFLVERTDYNEDATVFRASRDEDFDRLEQFIIEHRYYDAPGVWGAKIDLDKQVTTAIALGLGASKCLELGCFSGAIMSLLKRRGVDVTGLDASHLAFVLAYPEIRRHIVFGDLLSTDFPSDQFDVIVAMDILEHLSPIKFDKYIEKIRNLITTNGYVYVNSPMFGSDDVFGTIFPQYLKEWERVGDESFWRDLDCDDRGWPKHGHLVWASPTWWEAKFAAHGLRRDRAIERVIHRKLEKFFESAPGRKCLLS